MQLISANLLQVFGDDKSPRGWVRWAWITETLADSVVACVMLVLPVPELYLATKHSCPENLYVCHWDNKLTSLKDLLVSKETFQKACVYLLTASAMDLDMISPPQETLVILQQQILTNPHQLAVDFLEPHFVLWFWDAVFSQFATLTRFLTESDSENDSEWTTTTLHQAEDLSWQQAMQTWKDLTTQSLFASCTSSNILFTCFEGHAVEYNFFVEYVQRVNDALKALINNQLHLPGKTWFPTLMCPERTCCQQVTPAFITRKAILQHLPPPPVAETANLLRTLKQNWNYTAS